MKKRRQPGTFKEKEPDANALDARMLNPVREPVVPDVLDTAASPADRNNQFVSSSSPLGETPPGGDEPDEAGPRRKAEEKPTKKKRDDEFFNPSTPLEEKPKKFTAVHSRARAQKSNRPAPPPARKPARRNTR